MENLIQNHWVQLYGLFELIRNILGLIIYLPMDTIDWHTKEKRWYRTIRWTKASTMMEINVFDSVLAALEYVYGDTTGVTPYENGGVLRDDFPEHETYRIIMICIRDTPILYPSTLQNEICFLVAKFCYFFTK